MILFIYAVMRKRGYKQKEVSEMIKNFLKETLLRKQSNAQRMAMDDNALRMKMGESKLRHSEFHKR
jgi:hypothetical protein